MNQASAQPRPSSWPVWVILAALIGALAVATAVVRQPSDGPKTAHISGRLTLEGQPLARHSVVFMEPTRGDSAFGVTDTDGRYFIDSWKGGNMTPGQYKAHIKPPTIEEDASKDAKKSMPNEYANQYLDVSTTPLEYKIRYGENQVDIDLKRPKENPLKTE